jgi:hypothetical protein
VDYINLTSVSATVACGEVEMNANPSELVSLEEHTDVVHEAELVEVGAVSETAGGFFGHSLDGGGGYTFP